MKNILFVCSANIQRSKTAEDYFAAKYPNLHFDSAGTNLKICQKEGTNPMTTVLLDWADLVLVMEEKHRKLIKPHAKNKGVKKIKVLGIRDIYKYYQPELIELLEEKVEGYF